ncbi:MAG: helix-turn-helix domain-containing protein, partial [Psychrobacillus psychrodurans]
FTTKFTNRDLENMIGSSRETVSRTLTSLKKSKLISSDPAGNIILNMDKLKDELF